MILLTNPISTNQQNCHHKANKTTNKIKIDAEKGNKDDKLSFGLKFSPTKFYKNSLDKKSHFPWVPARVHNLKLFWMQK
jgi:hypothetical protein